MQKKLLRIITMFLAMVIVFGTIPITALENLAPPYESPSNVTHIEFMPLPDNIAEQVVPIGTSLYWLNLPDELMALVFYPYLEEISLPVSWESTPKYDAYTVGTYIFTAVLEYNVDVVVGLPEITVEVAYEIIAFATLPENVLIQEVPLGTAYHDLYLPWYLPATLRYVYAWAIYEDYYTHEVYEVPEWVETDFVVSVIWESAPEFNGHVLGEYIFTPLVMGNYAVTAQLPRIVAIVFDLNDDDSDVLDGHEDDEIIDPYVPEIIIPDEDDNEIIHIPEDENEGIPYQPNLPDFDDNNVDTIIAFAPLTDDIAEQVVPIGTVREDLNLPPTLLATVRTIVEQAEATWFYIPAVEAEVEMYVSVVWEGEFNEDTSGIYIFTANERNFIIEASLPTITVIVEELYYRERPLQRELEIAPFSATIDHTWYSQTGSVTISTEGQLISFRNTVHGTGVRPPSVTTRDQFIGRTVFLGADIHLTNPWIPINGFRGILDGQGFTIYNLNVQHTTLPSSQWPYSAWASFFDQIWHDVTIRNFGLQSINLSARHTDETSGRVLRTLAYAGAFVGELRGGTLRIENSRVVNGEIISYTFSNSSSNNDASAYSHSGGMVGFAGGGTSVVIENSYISNLDIRATSGTNAGSGLLGPGARGTPVSYAGGFIGRAYGLVNIRNSYVHNINIVSNCGSSGTNRESWVGVLFGRSTGQTPSVTNNFRNTVTAVRREGNTVMTGTTRGGTSDPGTIELSNIQMQNLNNFTGFAATNQWVVPTGANRPELRVFIRPSSISLNRTGTITMERNTTETLTATVLPTYAGSDTEVTWTSSNPGAVSLSGTGNSRTVTANTPAASSTITARTGNNRSASVTVNIPRIPVTEITLNETNFYLAVGETRTLTATVLPIDATNRSVTWTVTQSNPAGAVTVNNNGLVTGVISGGTATITARSVSDNNIFAPVTVTVPLVYIPVNSITIDPPDSTMLPLGGNSKQLEAIIYPVYATNYHIGWSSDCGGDIISVDGNGFITAIAEGIATITASAVNDTTNDVYDYDTIELTVFIPVDDIRFYGRYPGERGYPLNGLTIPFGVDGNRGEGSLTVIITPEDATPNEDGRHLEWNVYPTGIFTIAPHADNNLVGIITPIALGYATVTARALDETSGILYDSIVVTVVDETVAAGITLNRSTTRLMEGRVEHLIATVLPRTAENRSAIFTSDNEAVATINQHGMITAVSVGRAVIRATSDDNYDLYAECVVYVIPGRPQVRFNTLNSHIFLDDVGEIRLSWNTEGEGALSYNITARRNNQPFNDFTIGNSVTLRPTVVSGLSDNYTVEVVVTNAYGFTGRDTISFEVFNRNALANEFSSPLVLNYSNYIIGRTQQAMLDARSNLTLTQTFRLDTSNSPWTGRDALTWQIADGNIAEAQHLTTNGWMQATPYMAVSPLTPTRVTGLTDGSTVLTVTHERTGMATDVTVSVSTLQNQLLFVRAIPAQRTDVTFTDGTGRNHTVETNAFGEVALFNPNGIVGDIYFMSRGGGDIFLGSVGSAQLFASQQQNGVSLYPMHPVRLRRATIQTFFSYRPNGQPYTGRVEITAGLFRNGVFVPGSERGIQSPQSVGDGGSFTVVMDSRNFNEINVEDDLRLAYELRFIDGNYAPILVWVDGFTNNRENIRLDDAILHLRPWDGRNFVPVRYFYDNEFATFDVTNNTTFVGPDPQNPAGVLTAIVATVNYMNDLDFEDQFGHIPPGQRIQSLNEGLPFLSGNYEYLELRMTVDDNLRLQPGELRHFVVRGRNAQGVTHRVDVPFGLFNGEELVIPREYLDIDFDISEVMSDTSIFSTIFGGGHTGVALNLIDNLLPSSVNLPGNLPFVTMISQDTDNPLSFTIRGVYARNWSRSHTWKPGQRDPVFPQAPNAPTPPRWPIPPNVHWSEGRYAYAIHANRSCHGLNRTTSRIHSTPIYQDVIHAPFDVLSAPVNSSRCQICAPHWASFDASRARFATELNTYRSQRTQFEADMERFRTENQQFEAEFERAFQDAVNQQARSKRDISATFSANASTSGYFEGTIKWDMHTQSFQFEFVEVGITLAAQAGMRYSARIPIPVVPVPGMAVIISFEAGVGAELEAVLNVSDMIAQRSSNRDWMTLRAKTDGYIRLRGAIGADIWIAAADIGAFGELGLEAEFVTLLLSGDWGAQIRANAGVGIDFTYRLGPPIRGPITGRAYYIRGGPNVIWQPVNVSRTWPYGNQNLFNIASRSGRIAPVAQATALNSIASPQMSSISINSLPSGAYYASFAGNNNFAVAAWVEVDLPDYEWADWENIDAYSHNGVLDANDTIRLANLSNVTASIRLNGDWSTPVPITADNFPNINPIVAVSGERAVAIWQQMSFIPEGYENFDIVSTDLWYSIYNGGRWISPQQIYADINGIILNYSVAKNGSNVAIVISTWDYESGDDSIYVIHINNAEQETRQITQYRVSTDENLTDAPRIESFGNGFIFSYYVGGDINSSDLLLRKITDNGSVDQNFIHSVGATANFFGASPSFQYELITDDNDIAIAWTAYNALINEDVIYAVKLVDNNGEPLFTAPIPVDSSSVNIFGQFANSFLYETYVEYENVAPESYLPVYFTVINTGLSTITQISVNWHGGVTDTWSDLSIPPGGAYSRVVYTLLGTEINNLRYDITATFRDGSLSVTMENRILKIAHPDISIGSISVIRREHGIREFSVNLFNISDVPIRDGYRVQLSFFRDPMLTIPANIVGDTIISDRTRLDLINEGGLSLTYRYTVTSDDLVFGEIPSEGIRLFINAVILDNAGNLILESDFSANRGNVLLSGLWPYGQDSVVAIADQFNATTSTADISVHNRSMQGVSARSGRIVAHLLNETGAVIETQTHIIADAMREEDTLSQQIRFSGTGNDVHVSYEMLSTDASNSRLSSLRLQAIPFSLGEMIPSNGNMVLLNTTNIHNVNETLLTATAKNPNAVITINGEVFGDIASVRMPLYSPSTDVEILVTIGASSTTYLLSIYSDQLPEFISDGQETPTNRPEPPSIMPPIISPPVGGNDGSSEGHRTATVRSSRTRTGVRGATEINVLIPVATSAQLISEALLLAEANETVPVAIFFLESPYIGVEISTESLLALAEAQGALIITNGRFSMSIPYHQINAWGLEEASVLIMILEPIFLEDEDAETFWLYYLHNLSILLDDEELNLAATPINITLDTYNLNLTAEQKAKLEAFLLDVYGEIYKLIPGTLNSFSFYLNQNGLFGVILGEPAPEPPSIQQTRIRLAIGNPIFTVNGIPHTSDAAPFIDPQYSRTMVPLRIVAEALGADVNWIRETRTVIITGNGRTLSLQVDTTLPDGMGMPAIVHDRTFVPIAYVAQMLGAHVRWDRENRAVYIYDNRNDN